MSDDFNWIDLHHHSLPGVFVKSLREIGVTKLSGVPIPKWSLKKSLSEMDNLGIDKAVLSTPRVYFKDDKFSRRLARNTNIALAEIIKKHPTRYGGLASLPLPDITGAFEELEYALDELHLDGVTLLSNSKGMYLGNPMLEEIFAELNRRKAVVFIHPDDPPFAHMKKPDVPVMFLEWPFDTTRAVTNMVYGGVLDRYPQIRYILAHGGGTVPYLAWRISVLEYRQRNKTKILRSLYDLIIRKKGPLTGMKLLKRMYYDTTAVTAQSSLSALKELVEPSHIVIGTDLGAAPKLMASLILKDLKTFDDFNEEDLRTIARKGALELFPRLACA